MLAFKSKLNKKCFVTVTKLSYGISMCDLCCMIIKLVWFTRSNMSQTPNYANGLNSHLKEKVRHTVQPKLLVLCEVLPFVNKSNDCIPCWKYLLGGGGCGQWSWCCVHTMSCCGCCCCCCCCRHADRQKLCLPPVQPKCWRFWPASGPMPRKQKSPRAAHPWPAIMMALEGQGAAVTVQNASGGFRSVLPYHPQIRLLTGTSLWQKIIILLFSCAEHVVAMFVRAILIFSFTKHIHILHAPILASNITFYVINLR